MEAIFKLFILLITLSVISSFRIHPIPQKVALGSLKVNLPGISHLNFEFKIPQRFKQHQIFRSLQIHDIPQQFIDIINEYENNRLPKQKQSQFSLDKNELKINVILQSTETSYTTYENFQTLESYQISINEDFTVIQFQCHAYVSFLRALESFYQILQSSFNNNEYNFEGLPLNIIDQPSFGHRGIMIDTSRNFLSLTSIQDTIKGLSLTKMNVLHIHFTDSESFPIELLSYPNLTHSGAYSQEEIYTIEQLKALDKYAQKYGVIIIPEIDSPAHTRSWSNDPSLQDIDSCRNYPKQNWGQYCSEPPCGQLDISQDKTMQVVEGVMKDVDQIFEGKFMHLGGDEINTNCWDQQPRIKQFMKEKGIKDYNGLQTYYREQQSNILKNIGSQKTRIYWFKDNNIQTSDEAILQFWDSDKNYYQVKNIKNKIILSNYDQLYLDCGVGNQLGDTSWCDPYKTWKTLFQFDITAKGQIPLERILGAEAALWSEMNNSNDLTTKIFPRIASLGGNLWNLNQKGINLQELVKQLVHFKNQLESVGIKGGAVSSQFCEKNIEYCFF